MRVIDIYTIWLRLACFAVAVSSSFMALADEQRVLISFNEAGHQVQSIFYTEADGARMKKLAPETTEAIQFDPVTLDYPPAGKALVVWLDSQGMEQTRTIEPDPRLSHSPSHIEGVSQSRFGGREGVWLITGPAQSTAAYIMLPADLSVGLGPERWELGLTGN